MLKNYIKWQLKKWWPLALIIGLLAAIPFIGFIQAMPMVGYSNRSFKNPVPASLMTLIIISMVSTFVIPIFVFIYRTSLEAVDCFYQAGFDKRTIKRTRLLIGLGIILVAFTFAFFFGYLFLLMRYVSTPEIQVVSPEVTLVRYQINFGYLLLVYVFFLIALSAQYFINCFLVSLGDSIIVQLMLMVLGNIILSLFIIAPSAYLLAWTQSLSTSSLYLGIGPVATISSIYEFSNLVIGEALIYKDSSPYLIGSVMVNLLFAGGLAAFLFLRGDPSGERAGNWKPANKAIAIIPHVAALTLGLLISSLSLISTTALGVWSFSVYFTFFVGYYAFLSLLRKSFKPTKFDLITYICVVVAIITLSIIRSTTPPSLIYN